MDYYISDTHADHLLLSGTTRSSRKALRRVRHTHVMKTLRTIRESDSQARIIHLGDIFNGLHPKDGEGLGMVLSQLELCDKVIAGNHDIPNTVFKDSALWSLKDTEAYTDRIAILPFGESGYVKLFDKIAAIPHVVSQEVFEESLLKATEDLGGKGYMLLLHCNLMLSEDIAANSDGLNLTYQQGLKLTKAFKRVMVGHNHNPSEHFKDKLISIGTPFPLSFSDLTGDNRSFGYYRHDPKADVLTYVPTIDKSEIVTTIDVKDSPETSVNIFTRLSGDPATFNMTKMFVEVFDRGALAIKLKVTGGSKILEEDGGTPETETEVASFTAEAIHKKVLDKLGDKSEKVVKNYLKGVNNA